MASDDYHRVSRRHFLQSLGIAGLAGASGTLLVACGSDESDSCSDLSDLSAQEKKQRANMVSNLEYVEESPHDDQDCANCQLYLEEEYEGNCGGCQLFPGPVAAEGYCNSWAPAT